MTRVGRNYFNFETGRVQTLCRKDKDGKDVSLGMSLWQGSFASVRPGWKPFLNVDVANKPGYKKQPTLEFLCEVFNKDLKDLKNLTNDRDRERAEEALRGLKVTLNDLDLN